jgi:hypothetical protein
MYRRLQIILNGRKEEGEKINLSNAVFVVLFISLSLDVTNLATKGY